MKTLNNLDGFDLERDVNFILPNMDNNTYIDVEQILHNAKITGNIDILYACVESNLPIFTEGKRYLQNATANNHYVTVKMLLEHKLYDKQDYLISLELAGEKNFPEIFELLNKNARKYKINKLINEKI